MVTAVYYKWEWKGRWIYAPYITPISATKTAAPAIATATFKLLYGQGTWEDFTRMKDGGLLSSFAYCYIQIRGRDGASETILWTGIVPAETFQLLGKGSTGKKVDQVLQAYGLDMLLESRPDGARVKRGTTKPVWIDYLPTFNRRYEYGGGIVGNRSDQQIEGASDVYVFSDEGNDWTNYDIIKYLLKYYQQDNGPQFFLGKKLKGLIGFKCVSCGKTYDYKPEKCERCSGSNFKRIRLPRIENEEADINEALDKIVGVYNFSSQTVRSALNVLINQGRGFSWTYTVDSDNNVEIVPFSLLDKEMTLGDVTMPANKNKVALDLWENKMHTTVNVIQDTMHTYDKIVVRGARMKCCCTLRPIQGYKDSEGEIQLLPPSIEKGWTEAEETAYKNAAKNTEGYDELDDYAKAELNDKFRAVDRFSRVFTTFRIPHDWDWTIWTMPEEGKDPSFELVNPKLDSLGNITKEQAAYFNVDKRLLTFVPLKVGVDYSNYAKDENPINSEPEFRKLFVLVKDRSGKYQYAEKLENPAIIRPLMREMGLEMRFRPAYLAALNHWADAEPGQTAVGGELEYTEGLGIDYETMIATVFIETDQHVQLSYNLTNYENKRVLTIDIPDAELWYIVPGTIVDIDAGGKLVEDKCWPFLRDDCGRMRSALTAAVGWYGRRHNKVNITVKAIESGPELGTLIDNVDVAGVGAAGSVVTAVSWNFQNRPPTTTIQTDFAALNIAGIFGLGGSPRGGTAGTPGPLTAARKIDTLEKDVNAIKTELGKSPLRIETGGGASTGILAKITESLRRADETAEEPEDREAVENYKIKLLGGAIIDEWAADYGQYTAGDIAKYGEKDYDYKCLVTHNSEEAKKPTNTTFWKELGAGLDAWVSGYAGENLLETLPWFQIDDIVEVEYHSGKWWIKETATKVEVVEDDEIHCSLAWNETDERAMGVF